MRWWFYDGKKTTGPFTKEDLARLDAFSPETPLCREHKLGGPEEEWRRAVDIEEIAGIFPPATRAAAGPAPAGKPGPWPPDEELRDVDDYRSVEMRMQIVDRSIAAAQDRITLRTERFHKLQSELGRRLDNAAALEDNIRAMAAKIGGFLGLREEIDLARAAMAMQQKRITELQEQMKVLETPPPPPPPPEPPPPPPPPQAELKTDTTATQEEESAPKKGRRKKRRKRRRGAVSSGADPFGGENAHADFTAPPDSF